jgi:hypothetical protein
VAQPLNRWDPNLYMRRAAFVSAGGRDLIELLDPRAGEPPSDDETCRAARVMI